MSVTDPAVVDFVSINLSGNAVLTISDHLPWDRNNEHLLILQNKINAYLSVIESGAIYKMYPNSEGRNFLIYVFAKYKPDDDNLTVWNFLNQTKKLLESAGYEFELEVVEST